MLTVYSTTPPPTPTRPVTPPPAGKEGSKVLDGHVSTLSAKAKETAAALQRDFMAELRKLQEAEAAKQRKS